MSTKWILPGVAGLLSGIVLLTAWRAHRQAHALEAERAKIEAARNALAAEARKLEAAERSEVTRRSELQAKRASLRAESTASHPAKPDARAATPVQKPALDPNAVLAEDPKLQALAIAAHRARFETSHGPLLRALRLTREQIEQLGTAKARYEAMQMDLALVMRDQNLPPNDPAILRLRREAADALRATELEVLGPLGREKMQTYENVLPARTIVDRFAGAMSIGGEPLRLEQAERLTQALVTAGAQSSEGQRIDVAMIDWSAVDRDAAAILSEKQLALFRRIEPAGGGNSRWMAQFNRAMQDAAKAMATDKSGRQAER